MTSRFRRPTIRSIAAILGAVAATAAAHGQTVCGAWEPMVADLLGDIGLTRTRVSDLIVFDAGDGPMLYMAGNFEVVVDPVFGEVRAPGLARFDGERWQAVPGLDGPGLELDRRAIALEVFDDGSGPVLFVGGEFTTAAGLPVGGIIRWDGASWNALAGSDAPARGSTVYDVHPHDAGDGTKIYVSGVLLDDAGQSMGSVRRWDGMAWSTPGPNPPGASTVFSLESFGHDLFAAGRFESLGAEPAPGLARFDGHAWSAPMGSDQQLVGFEFWPLERGVLDDRPMLLTSGFFRVEEAGRTIAQNVAAWDGARWNSLGVIDSRTMRNGRAMATMDDGDGEAIFVGGFQVAGVYGAVRLRDGQVRPLQGMIDGPVYALLAYDDGAGPMLLAGGEFENVQGVASYLAGWRPSAPCILDFSEDCVVNVLDYLAFQDRFMAGDPRADFDGDGQLTIFDFLAFQNAFDAGCP